MTHEPKHAFKAPAFQLYAKEFLQDEAVIAMELDAVGAYIILLCHQWNEGSIPADSSLQARICRTTLERMEAIWPQVAGKFSPVKHTKDRLANMKLEIVREEKNRFSVKQATSGKLGADKRWNRKPSETSRMDGVAHSGAMATLLGSAWGNDGSGSGSGSGSENPPPTPAARGGVEGNPPETDRGTHGRPSKQQSECDATLDLVAQSIHARHPAVRRDCGAAAVRKKLLAILKHKAVPAADRVSYLRMVEATHGRMCATEQWMKDGGEFAKSLENWLAPTMERYEAAPPPQAAPAAGGSPYTAWNPPPARPLAAREA